MGDLLAELRWCGLASVSVNGNKKIQQNSNGDPPAKNLKSKNFLPNFPKGEDKLTLKNSWLKNEIKKGSANGLSVNHRMNQTFSLRRKEIVKEQPSAKQMLEHWPPLFCKQQVSI